MSQQTDKQAKRSLLGRMFGRGSDAGADQADSSVPPRAEPVDAGVQAPNSASDTATPAGSARTDTAPPSDTLQDPAAPAPASQLPAASARVSWFQRLKSGLSKTSSQLADGISTVFSKRKLDADTLEQFEDLLIRADLGVETAMRISDAVSQKRYDKGLEAEAVRQVLADEVADVLRPVAQPLQIEPANQPHVILMVGVNGTGKTTTIGKLAKHYTDSGLRVMLAAGDTFRAAAIDQLKVWGERTGAPVIAREVGSDAAGLAFDALKSARDGGYDLLLMDTAGRLQNKQELMAELEKVIRVMKKLDAAAPHDVVLVLDATTGQNAISQVEVFRDRADVSGIVMTKLDGTARGGILVAIAARFGLPVHAIGVGEGSEDLQSFDADQFARAIALS